MNVLQHGSVTLFYRLTGGMKNVFPANLKSGQTYNFSPVFNELFVAFYLLCSTRGRQNSKYIRRSSSVTPISRAEAYFTP